MKVNLFVQPLCVPRVQLRGIPYYEINLVKSLVDRHYNDYSISFFDYQRRRNNAQYIAEYLDKEHYNSLDIRECNSLSYKTLRNWIASGIHSEYANEDYNKYMGIEADIVHFPHIEAVPINVNTRIVVTIHDLLPCIPNLMHEARDSIWQMSFLNSLNYVQNNPEILIIVDSQHTKMELALHAKVEEERINVVPLAHDPKIHFHDTNTLYLSDWGVHDGYLLYLGAFDDRKGIGNILDALQILKTDSKYKNLKLVLAGDYNLMSQKIREKLDGCKNVNDVILTGFVNDEQKRQLLSHAQAFLFPSEYEGFGLPILEAMACGSPVITTNVTSLPEVGGNAALYVSPNQPEELAAQIEKLLDSDSLRQEYIQKGYEQAKKFSWDKTAAMTEKVYNKALNM